MQRSRKGLSRAEPREERVGISLPKKDAESPAGPMLHGGAGARYRISPEGSLKENSGGAG